MFVLDATTLASLIDSHPPLWELWNRANDGDVTVGVPACAIVEVGQSHGVASGAWEAILWPPSVVVLPLTAANAARRNRSRPNYKIKLGSKPEREDRR